MNNEQSLKTIPLSTKMLTAAGIHDYITQIFNEHFESVLRVVFNTDTVKSVSFKTPIFKVNNSDIKYFVKWDDSLDAEEINDYSQGMTLEHTYDSDGNHNVQIYSYLKDNTYNPIIKTTEAEFNDCSNLVSVEMPESLVFIDEESFCKCSSLTNIKFSENTITLAKKAFNKCTSLTNVTLPKGLAYMFSRVFEGCTNLEKINIYDTNVTTIPFQCFKDCTALKDIGILNGSSTYIYKVQKFDTECFINSGIEKISFASPFEITVGASAFKNCKNLVSVNFDAGSGVPMHLKGSCFSGCTALTSEIDMGKVALEGGAIFQGCTGLTKVTFKSSIGIDKIPGSTFRGCTGLTTIDMSQSQSIKYIGSSAFNECTNLTKVKLPRSLENIDSEAFSNCTALVAKFDEEKASGGDIECINIPDNLQYCDWNAFNSKSGHTSISRYFLTGEYGAQSPDGYRYQSLKGVIRERICNALKDITDTSTISDILNAFRKGNY